MSWCRERLLPFRCAWHCAASSCAAAVAVTAGTFYIKRGHAERMQGGHAAWLELSTRMARPNSWFVRCPQLGALLTPAKSTSRTVYVLGALLLTSAAALAAALQRNSSLHAALVQRDEELGKLVRRIVGLQQAMQQRSALMRNVSLTDLTGLVHPHRVAEIFV